MIVAVERVFSESVFKPLGQTMYFFPVWPTQTQCGVFIIWRIIQYKLNAVYSQLIVKFRIFKTFHYSKNIFVSMLAMMKSQKDI